MHKDIKLFKAWDIIIILILLIFVFIFFMVFGSNNKGNIAVITKDNSEIYRIKLSEVKNPYEIKLNDEYNVIIKVENDGISFIHSDCPDKVCVNTGKIFKQNQTAVCLPAKVSVKIISSKESIDIIDAVTG